VSSEINDNNNLSDAAEKEVSRLTMENIVRNILYFDVRTLLNN